MKKINKSQEPNSLTAWKRKNPSSRYDKLSGEIRRDIRQALMKEQFYICAYCCQRIEGIAQCHNEHVEAQDLNQNRTLDYTNLVASCNTKNQCGQAHQSQLLPLTPLMPECEEELRFKISGRVEGLSERARKSIKILNLGDIEANNKAIIEKRKRLTEALLWTNGVNSKDGLNDDYLIKELIEVISQPKNTKLESFASVVVNILRNWIAE